MPDIDCEWTEFPVCPYCGSTDQDWWDGLDPKDDGDVWESSCGNCDKEYSVTLDVISKFTTLKPKA